MTFPTPDRRIGMTAAGALIIVLSGCSSAAPASNAAHSAASAAAQAGGAAQTAGAATSDDAGGALRHTAAGDHPCSLLSEAEATTVLGKDPGAGQESPAQFSAGTCVYGQRSSVIRISVDPTNGKAIFASDLSSLTSANAASVVVVPGLGDEAVVTPSGASESTIFMDKAGSFVEIALGVDAGDPPKDKVIALATTIAGRV